MSCVIESQSSCSRCGIKGFRVSIWSVSSLLKIPFKIESKTEDGFSFMCERSRDYVLFFIKKSFPLWRTYEQETRMWLKTLKRSGGYLPRFDIVKEPTFEQIIGLYLLYDSVLLKYHCSCEPLART